MKRTILILLFMSLLPMRVIGGTPYYVDYAGPYRWANGVIDVYLDKDIGKDTLDPIGKKIRTWLLYDIYNGTGMGAFDIWNKASLSDANNVVNTTKVAGVKLRYAGDLPDDISGSSYGQYFLAEDNAYNPNRKTVIIFDKDGAIFQDLEARWGVNNLTENVIGITDIFAVDQKTMTIKNGTIILNGQWLQQNGNDSSKVIQFKIALLHELGHLINLDHSQVNIDDGLPQYLPIMFPEPQGDASQLRLHPDDIAWSAALYASVNPNITDGFCRVIGEIVDKKGRGIQGIEVLATEVGVSKDTGDIDNPEAVRRIQTYSAVTGAFVPPCDSNGVYSTNGSFVIPGLRPGGIYQIRYKRLDTWCSELCDNLDDKDMSTCPKNCTLASGINPFAPPRLLEEDGVIQFEGKDTVTCKLDGGGNIIDVGTIKLSSVDLDDPKYYRFMDYYKPPSQPDLKCKKIIAGNDDNGNGTTKKGWCGMISGRGDMSGLYTTILLIVVLVSMRRLIRRWA